MPSINWPTLPPPLQDEYEEQAPENWIRSRMDMGPEKVRRRQTSAVRRLGLSYRLTGAEVAQLDTFYSGTTRYGTLPFNFTHPRTAAVVAARFAAPPAYSGFEHLATARVELEVLP